MVCLCGVCVRVCVEDTDALSGRYLLFLPCEIQHAQSGCFFCHKITITVRVYLIKVSHVNIPLILVQLTLRNNNCWSEKCFQGVGGRLMIYIEEYFIFVVMLEQAAPKALCPP